jgi:hypothetical protein
MRQVDQRVSVRCALQALERDALPAYIAHRLTVAGAGSDRVEFAPQAVDLLYTASHGNPRVLNLIADKCLERGHVDRMWTITADIVSAAVNGLGYSAAERINAAKPSESLSTPDTLAALPPAPVVQAPIWRELNEDGPQFLVEEPPITVADGAANVDHGRDRVQRAAMAIATGIVLAAAIVGVSEWSVRRQESAPVLPWPALPSSPTLAVSAGLAPVAPPAGFFAPVSP